VDIYVLPVEKIPENGFLYPFIVYGAREFLEIAVLKGCKDYIREPWGREELLFRVQKTFSGLAKVKTGDESAFIVLDGKLMYGDRKVSLSFPEALVFRVLLANTSKLVSREALYYTLWGKLPSKGSRVIDVHISSLRKKLKYLRKDKGYNAIRSVRGYGYLFTG